MKQKYNILTINSNNYLSDDWKNEFDPQKNTKESHKKEPLSGVCLIKV